MSLFLKVKRINITENPYIETETCRFIVANCDDDAAEVRVMGNKITIFDSDGFSDSEVLLEVNENNPLELEILLIK